MPIFFSESDLKWLEGSPFLSQVFDKQADMRKDYESIKEIAPEIEEYGVNEFFWARMTASSRIFGIVIDNVKTDAFVPYAGFFLKLIIKRMLRKLKRHAESQETKTNELEL